MIKIEASKENYIHRITNQTFIQVNNLNCLFNTIGLRHEQDKDNKLHKYPTCGTVLPGKMRTKYERTLKSNLYKTNCCSCFYYTV